MFGSLVAAAECAMSAGDTGLSHRRWTSAWSARPTSRLLRADARAAPAPHFRSRVCRALAAAIGAGLRDRGALARTAPGRARWFRVQENFVHGRFLYVDDLVTDESERRHGHGARLLDRLKAEGRALGCRKLVLDTALENTLATSLLSSPGPSPAMSLFASIACSIDDCRRLEIARARAQDGATRGREAHCSRA